MSRVYDSWEKLVGAVLRREKDRQLAYCESITTISSADFSSRPSFASDVHADDDSSTTTADIFRRSIFEWQKGEFLGHGSLGSVYEGMNVDGLLFSVEEISLPDQGDEGKQHIAQLRQEITFLSQFEDENIVQYLGSDMDESHLHIFHDLVSKGSLMWFYQKYTFGDSQVSSYTRQILHGLKYLHDMNVVHRRWGHGLAADIWSLGCTVLEMLTGSFPYSNFEVVAVLYKIGWGERPHIPASISGNARDFILECLQVDPSLRPTAAELLEHPFVNRP